MPMLNGEMKERNSPIAFEAYKDGQVSLIGDRYKIISIDNGESFMMFDIINDPNEQNDIAEKKSVLLAKMKSELTSWQESCKRSLTGEDY